MSPDLANQPDTQVFQKGQESRAALGWLVVGIGSLVLAVVGFGLALLLHFGPLHLQIMATVPTLVGIGALLGYWVISRTPNEVRVSDCGLTIVRLGVAYFEWKEVGWSTIQAVPLASNRRQLRIYDVRGKTIACIGDAIADFDSLAEAVARHVAAKGDDTAKRVQLGKARRSAVFVGAGGLMMLAIAVIVAWMTNRDIRAARLLEEAGVPGQGQIEERFIAPDGVTCRLVYRVTSADGRSDTRNAEVERAYWWTLEDLDAKTVPIVYVPDEPSISRLSGGEVAEDDPFKNPVIGYGVPALVAVISIVCFIAAPLMWNGWDIDIDSKTRKISIKRFGTGR
jgi:hypothetical protein